MSSFTDNDAGARPLEGRLSITEDEVRPNSTLREDGSASQPALSDATGQPLEVRSPLGASGNEGPINKANEASLETSPLVAQDPLAGMSEGDRWGIKGLLTLMAKYPSYHALAHGMNPAELGLDLTSDK